MSLSADTARVLAFVPPAWIEESRVRRVVAERTGIQGLALAVRLTHLERACCIERQWINLVRHIRRTPSEGVPNESVSDSPG